MRTDMATEYPVKTTSTSFQLVDALFELGGAGISELADHLCLSKSAVHKHLHTLEELGYIIEEDDVFYPGLRFLERGVQSQSRHPLYSAAQQEVNNLASTTGEWVGLATEERNRGVYLITANGSHERGPDVQEGRRFALHETAPGKAILAHAPRESRETLLEATGVDLTTELEAELRTIQDRQLVYGSHHENEQARCVAASITNPDETVIGSVCVVGSKDRLSGKRLKEDISGLVLSTARTIGNSITNR